MGPVDHFERLGLPRRFSIPADEIERRYLERSRGVHPDVHQLGSTSEQMASLELSSAINEAYQALRDPFRRADHLLTLEGGPSASEVERPTPEFLEQSLTLRMEIEEASTSEDVERLEGELDGRKDALLGEIETLFGDLATAEDRGPILTAIRERLNSWKYVKRLREDLHAD